MRMYIILVALIHFDVNIKPSLYTHIIGFPYHTNSKSSNNVDSGKHEIGTGYGILYAAEPLPHETGKSTVVENIQKVHTDKIEEVQNNISKGLLAVVDSDTGYKENTSGTYIVDFLLSNLSRMKQKAQHMTKGAMICNAPDPFFSHGKYDVFLDFEEKIDKMLPNDVGLLCWCKPKWLNKLSLAYTISVLTHHKCTIDKQWKYKEWDSNTIIDLVSKGIDNNLGEGSCVLLFQTMKSAYKLNQDDIVQRPAIFEETLKKMLSKDDVNSLINSIFEEIIKEAGFTLMGSTSNER